MARIGRTFPVTPLIQTIRIAAAAPDVQPTITVQSRIIGA